MTETVSGQSAIDAPSGVDSAPDDASSDVVRHDPPLRRRLRDETRDAHERLDASFAALGRGDPEDYALFLRVNAACLATIEPVLDASPLAKAMPDLAAASRHGAAAADIEALGVGPIASSPFPIPAPSLAEAVGIAYVVEGSRLGARMIVKQMERRRNARPDEPLPTSFLESAGEPERFRRFLGLVEPLVVSRAERDAAVTAAGTTFAYFLQAVRAARAVNHDGGAN